MTTTIPDVGQFATEDSKDGNVALAGETPPTIRDQTQQNLESTASSPPSVEGPKVSSQPTTLTLLAPLQLKGSPLLPSLHSIVVEAFRGNVSRNGVVLLTPDRFSHEGQFLEELGDRPDTFTYILSFSGSDEVVATATGKRYLKAGEPETWNRVTPVRADTEAWELSTMAVDPKLQRQGLAAYLMNLVEDEIKRRFMANHAQEVNSKQLVEMITCVKEVNESFYSKRCFTKDYETFFPAGYLGSERGFHVLHMSRKVQVEELRKVEDEG